MNKLCPHGKHKQFCALCDGSWLCEHKVTKYICGDSGLCKTPHCPTVKNGKYDGYCWYCFTNLFLDKPIVRRCRTKENAVATFLKEKFPNVTWKCNKSVENGCSRRRPDLLLGMGSHIVIVEVDEHSHVGYDPTCEEKRLGEIWGDVYHRQIVFVRFNTDGYKDDDGNNVPSPWAANHYGCTIRPKWKAAWEVRLDDLRLTVEHYIESSNINEEFKLVHLYY